MPDFMKTEVFHKILHDAERDQISVYESPAYTGLSEADKVLFEEIKTIWELSRNYQASSTEFNTSAAFQSFLQRAEKEEAPVSETPEKSGIIRLFSPANLLRYAAVFALLLVAVYFFTNKTVTYEGGQSGLYVHLEDGSDVWLKENAVLQVVEMTGNKRQLQLSGDAYFDVEADTKRPFKVEMKGLTITVTGTRFVLQSDLSAVEVYEGSVEVKGHSKTINLNKNQKAAFTGNDFTYAGVEGDFPDWVNPILAFDNVPLDRVVKDLEAFFGITIQLTGQKNWSACPFTSGSLAETKLEDILTSLKLTYEMEIVKENDTLYTFKNIRCK